MTHIVIEMKCSVDELHNRLDIAEESTANGPEEVAQEAAESQSEGKSGRKVQAFWRREKVH